MRLQIISREEYVLSSKDFKDERAKKEREGISNNNEANFLIDLSKGDLNRYKDSFVAYKEGVRCGQSEDRNSLLETASFELFTPNLSIFKVPKRGEELKI